MSIIICPKRKLVLDTPSHCIVTGGPGSGKTTLALLKAVKRIEMGLKPGQQVLFLSFSRAAVTRIADAAKQLIADTVKQSALSIHTYHSFFWKILQGYSYLLGIPRNIKILLSYDEKALSNGINKNSPNWNEWEVKRIKFAFEKGNVCFDLFAPLLLDLLQRSNKLCSRIAKRFPLILVDEAQDTNEQQWNIIKCLSRFSQIIFFADNDQMIYDFLPGVCPTRILKIQEELQPLVISLGTENNRSPDTEIATFAKDILESRIRQGTYKGVSRMLFGPTSDKKNAAIRSSIAILSKKIFAETGKHPNSIALIASYGRGVADISSALQLEKAIQHRVLFDEAFTLLSSRVVAFLLEPKEPGAENENIAILLEIIGSAFRAKGTITSLKTGSNCFLYASRCREGNIQSIKIIQATRSLLLQSTQRRLTGDPQRDWLSVKNSIKDTGEVSLMDIAQALDYLVVFARGRYIREGLSETWMKYSAYVGARDIVDAALTQEQLYSSFVEENGIYVMNAHKCKGKQFDGIILYRQQYNSPFIWYNDQKPFPVSRRLLYMVITRAKYHVLILEEAISKCPICSSYNL